MIQNHPGETSTPDIVHKTLMVPLDLTYPCLHSGGSAVATLEAAEEVQRTGLFWRQTMASSSEGALTVEVMQEFEGCIFEDFLLKMVATLPEVPGWTAINPTHSRICVQDRPSDDLNRSRLWLD